MVYLRKMKTDKLMDESIQFSMISLALMNDQRSIKLLKIAILFDKLTSDRDTQISILLVRHSK